MGEGSRNSNKQRANFAQDGERHFTTEKVKVKQLTVNAALTTYSLYNETMRDGSTLTYDDNVLMFILWLVKWKTWEETYFA